MLFRVGEKEILHWYIRFADFVLGVCDLDFKAAKKVMQSLPAEFETARDYLQQALIPMILKESS